MPCLVFNYLGCVVMTSKVAWKHVEQDLEWKKSTVLDQVQANIVLNM